MALDDSTSDEIKEAIIDETMKYFGLTKSKNDLVKVTPLDKEFLDFLITGGLEITESLSDPLFQRVKEKGDRDILRELKKRGSVLESDLKELSLPGLDMRNIKSTLDYLSGEEYKLIDKKYAVICNRTNEMLFLVKDRTDLEGSKLLCPKCSAEIGSESLLAYYESTKKLKELLDGSRWMPLLIRDALIRSNVPASNIFTEVKHENDQIDVLVVYQKRIFVIEAKDRSVSLNDAYKLSAKTSHLESWIEESYSSKSDLFTTSRSVIDGRIVYSKRRAGSPKDLIPIIISTSEISPEACDLLRNTNKKALFLENCENELNKFIGNLIGTVDKEEMGRAFNNLIGREAEDSVSNFVSAISLYGFIHWFKAK